MFWELWGSREIHKATFTSKPQSISISQRISPMSEHDQTREVADESAMLANEAFANGKAVAEQSAQAVQQSYSVTVENMRGYNLKMIDMAQANIEGVFEFARQFASAKHPSDIMELWMSHAKKQFEMLSEQTKELSALGQKMAGESAEPLTRSVNQAFKKAS
jgi:phasin